MHKYLMRGNEDVGARLLSLVATDRPEGNRVKLKCIKFHQNIGKCTFTVGMVRH